MTDSSTPQVVYLVDDDTSVRTSLTRLVRVSGFKVRAFDSANDFLAQVSPDWVGCLLLDMTLPHVTGLAVQQQLALRGITLPVIALSARDDDGVRDACKELGARYFLRKPVDHHALLDAICWVTGTDARPTSSRPPA